MRICVDISLAATSAVAVVEDADPAEAVAGGSLLVAATPRFFPPSTSIHTISSCFLLMLTSLRETKKIPYRFAPDSDYLPVDVFLEKPVSPELLIKTVKDMLGERREKPEYPL